MVQAISRMSATTTSVEITSAKETRSSATWMSLLGLLLFLYGAMQIAQLLTTPDRMLRDFVQEWTSARNWKVGRPVYEDMRKSIPFHIPKARAGDLHFNAHPPVAVMMALPFGSLGYFQSLRVWNIVSLACVVVALLLLVGRQAFQLNRAEQLLVGGIVASSSVLATQVVHGQLNGVLLLLFVAGWLTSRHERTILAGVCIGAATALKLFPGLLVLFFIARRQWKGAIAALVSCLSLNLLAVGILGVDAIRDYLLVVMPQANRFSDTWPNASLLGFLSRLLDGSFGQSTPLIHWPQVARAAWLAISIFGVALTWRATARERSPQSHDLIFSVWVGLMLLVSPITWDHYFLLAVLPLVALWKHSNIDLPSPKVFLVCATLLLVVLSPYTVWKFIVPGFAKFGMTPAVATPLRLMTVISFQFYTATALFGFSLRCLNKESN